MFDGNYWSDNGEPDLDGDGGRDRPYRLSNVFDHLRGNLTAADLFAQGLGADVLAAAERTFPVLDADPGDRRASAGAAAARCRRARTAHRPAERRGTPRFGLRGVGGGLSPSGVGRVSAAGRRRPRMIPSAQFTKRFGARRCAVDSR